MTTRRTALLQLAAAALACRWPIAFGQASSRISLAQMEEMFHNLRAKTSWNIDGPLLWGYYFFDPSPAKLALLGSELQPAGYRLVGIEQVQGKRYQKLHLEREETHTPASLHATNRQFYALAARFGAVYDGMDVGPAPAGAK